MSVYDYGFRIYNPTIGKFLSVDPLARSYPWYTPYQFAGNKPIFAIDLDGLEEKRATDIDANKPSSVGEFMSNLLGLTKPNPGSVDFGDPNSANEYTERSKEQANRLDASLTGVNGLKKMFVSGVTIYSVAATSALSLAGSSEIALLVDIGVNTAMEGGDVMSGASNADIGDYGLSVVAKSVVGKKGQIIINVVGGAFTDYSLNGGFKDGISGSKRPTDVAIDLAVSGTLSLFGLKSDDVVSTTKKGFVVEVDDYQKALSTFIENAKKFQTADVLPEKLVKQMDQQFKSTFESLSGRLNKIQSDATLMDYYKFGESQYLIILEKGSSAAAKEETKPVEN